MLHLDVKYIHNVPLDVGVSKFE